MKEKSIDGGMTVIDMIDMIPTIDLTTLINDGFFIPLAYTLVLHPAMRSKEILETD